MAKTLTNKNKKTDNVDDTLVGKGSKKKKNVGSNQNDQNDQNDDNEELIEIDKKPKKKRKNVKDAEATQERSTKKSKNDESNEDLAQNEKDSKDGKKKPTLSKRGMKKEKEEQRKAQQREVLRQESIKKAMNYISMWKFSKNQWKFEKVKQIWLMDHLLDDKSVPESIFPTVLEYFEGCKGMARETLLKKGMDVIKMCEQKQDDSGKIIEGVEYNRARKLLQALPTES